MREMDILMAVFFVAAVCLFMSAVAVVRRERRLNTDPSLEKKMQDISFLLGANRVTFFELNPVTLRTTWHESARNFFPAFIPGTCFARGFFELVHPDDKKYAKRLLEELVEDGNGETSVSTRVRIMDLSGEYSFCHWRLFAQRNQTGKVCRLFGFVIDISEMSRRERAVIEERNRYSETVQLMQDLYASVVLVDVETGALGYLKSEKREYLRPTSAGMGQTDGESGHSYSGWLENVLQNLLHEDYREEFREKLSLENLEKIFENGEKVRNMECLCYDADKDDYGWVKIDILPASSGYCGKEVMLCVRDINAERASEVALRRKLHRALKKAELADQARCNLGECVTGDFGVPVSVLADIISETAEYIKNNDASRALDNLDRAMGMAKYMKEIMNKIAELTLMYNHGLKLNEKRIDINDLVRSCESYFNSLDMADQISFMFVGNVEGKYIGDGQRLKQCFLELVKNAVKFNKPGGRIKIEVFQERNKEERHKDDFIFQVTDNGVGMDEEERGMLFQPSGRAALPGVSKRRGTGTGLSIVKCILDSMGGKVNVWSGREGGTTVRLCFSLVRAGREETTISSCSGGGEAFMAEGRE